MYSQKFQLDIVIQKGHVVSFPFTPFTVVKRSGYTLFHKSNNNSYFPILYLAHKSCVNNSHNLQQMSLP